MLFCCSYFSDIEGYTPAMTDLFNKIKERKEIEEEKLAVISINNKYAKTAKKTNKRKKKLDSRDKSPPVTRTKSASGMSFLGIKRFKFNFKLNSSGEKGWFSRAESKIFVFEKNL